MASGARSRCLRLPVRMAHKTTGSVEARAQSARAPGLQTAPWLNGTSCFMCHSEPAIGGSDRAPEAHCLPRTRNSCGPSSGGTILRICLLFSLPVARSAKSALCSTRWIARRRSTSALYHCRARRRARGLYAGPACTFNAQLATITRSSAFHLNLRKGFVENTPEKFCTPISSPTVLSRRVLVFKADQYQWQRWHLHALRLEGPEQIHAAVFRRSFQR